MTTTISKPYEQIDVRDLRDDDVLVNPETGETTPVRLIAPHNGLILVWTDSVNGFAISPTATVAITRRTETIKARDLRKGDAIKGLDGSFVPVLDIGRDVFGICPVNDEPVLADFGHEGTWKYRAADDIEIAKRGGDTR
jgi:hypothetical protein